MAEMSAADVAAVTGMNRNGGFLGNDGIMGMFGLIVLLGILNGGFGNNRGGPDIGMLSQQFATRDQVQNGFEALNNSDAQRDILGAVTTAGTNGIQATKEAQYETIAVIKDAQVALTRELGNLGIQGANILAKLNECCCSILRGQDSIKYDNLKNTNDLSNRINDAERNILGALNENKIEALQSRIRKLELDQALCGVVRYPTSATYDAGTWPFGGSATATTAG